MWLKTLIKNHILTNLLFILVLVVGIVIYQKLPREEDPSINFNWVQIVTVLPGASAKDIELKITDIIEESIKKVKDIRFVSSTSRENVSSILVRFHEMDERIFDKRVTDLRREINNIEDRLPIESQRPDILEVTSANAFPTATVLVSAPADDENLRRQASALEKDLVRIPGVDRVQNTALREPEIQIRFDLDKMQLLSVSPVDISNAINAFFNDVSAGSARIAKDQWLVRIQGTTTDPEQLAQLPILSTANNIEIRLTDVAQVVRARAKADRMVSYQGKPAVLFAIMKQESANTLALVERVDKFIEQRNKLSQELGVEFILVDDQTLSTKNALSTMQNNALLGLVLVLFVTWAFLGGRISLLVTIGIPFTLAGTFIALHFLDQTLNTSVLLAIVIALGMLVDDAVVVVESIYTKLRAGQTGFDAAWQGLTDVIRPVTASVLTTMAAFLPLMLLPGVLGKFMMVIPLVVSLALAVSLIEAYWMLPSHILSAKVNFNKTSRIDTVRQQWTQKIKTGYGKLLVKVMRRPKTTLAALLFLFVGSITAISANLIRTDFFASDTMRLFYVNVEMPPTSSLQETMDKTQEVERIIEGVLHPEELRSVVSYAGQMFTEISPRLGYHLGQVMVSLTPQVGDMRSVETLIQESRAAVQHVIGPVNISFLKNPGGPPVSKPVSVKVRGDNPQELREASDELIAAMKSNEQFQDISDDDGKGRFALQLTLNADAINRLGVNPVDVQRNIKMLIDGEIVNYVQQGGDRIALRVKSNAAVENDFDDVDKLLALTIPTVSGHHIPLRELVHVSIEQVKTNIRHYNFKATITVEADIDKALSDTVTANQLLQQHWETIAHRYPNTSLDFTGQLDDIKESMNAIGKLFLLGICIMYLILSTQFQSYFQPFLILLSVPMAFVGVILGLLVSGNPLSLYTMYGIVALAGIAVNASIVLITTANTNMTSGISVINATFYAARRRLFPIMITTLTTVAGLFSLAFGLGGHSMIWSPVATSIVWGLLFSSSLTLFAIPVVYQLVMKARSPTLGGIIRKLRGAT